MADEINIVVKATDSFSGVFSDLGNIMTGIKSTIDLVSGAFNAAADFVGQFVDSASESEQALVGLQTVLKSTNGEIGYTSQFFEILANKIQETTMYSDEQVLSAEAMLLRFENINDNIFPETVKLTTDLAAALGIDLTTAARQIGMALDEPEQGMGRLNTQFRIFTEEEMKAIKAMADSGDMAGAQAIIMDGLREKVGGAAEAFGNTYAGQLKIAQNAMDNLKESIGFAFLPVLTEMTQGIISFINTPEVQEFVNNFAQGLSELLNGLKSGTIDLTSVFKDGVSSIDWQALSQTIADGLNSIDWKQVSTGLDNIADAITIVLTEIDWSVIGGAIWESLIQGFMVVIDNGADMLIQLMADAFGDPDVATFQAGVQEGLNKIKGIVTIGFDDIGIAIVDGLKAGIQWAWGNLKAMLSFGFDDIINFVKDILGISSPSSVFAGIGRNIVEGLMQGWTGMFSVLKSIITSGVNDILTLFQPVLDILGIETTTGGASGSFGGFGNTTPTGNNVMGQTVHNYFYGPVYFGQSLDSTNYDCPSPNPFMNATNGSLNTSGI